MSALFVSHVSNLIKLTILVRRVELYGKFTRNCILFERWMIYPDQIFQIYLHVETRFAKTPQVSTRTNGLILVCRIKIVYLYIQVSWVDVVNGLPADITWQQTCCMNRPVSSRASAKLVTEQRRT